MTLCLLGVILAIILVILLVSWIFLKYANIPIAISAPYQQHTDLSANSDKMPPILSVTYMIKWRIILKIPSQLRRRLWSTPWPWCHLLAGLCSYSSVELVCLHCLLIGSMLGGIDLGQGTQVRWGRRRRHSLGRLRDWINSARSCWSRRSIWSMSRGMLRTFLKMLKIEQISKAKWVNLEQNS